MNTPTIELTLEQIQEQLKRFDSEQLKAIKEAALEQRKEKLEEEKQNRPKPLKSHYQCQGCDCGGFTGMAGLTIRCMQHEKNPTKAPTCLVVKTWEMTGRKKPVETIQEPKEEPLQLEDSQEQLEDISGLLLNESH